MYEQSFQIWDLAIVAIAVGGAGYYMYRKIFKKKWACGSGCDSCSSAPKKNT
ncbi:FeoB-associated Cys-rich membrane protein [Vibrio mexicanus]|uniref:FeoB-associated Cys-rich membrane protein n=1 Tax=Vibrio mexicanus TaxID=1004326 RepID=UPI000A04DCD8|nr:FeoB-associated Cys-rich membrane protein [Vibrio mexicanus]